MENTYETIKKIAGNICDRVENLPEVALILGSGLGGMIDEIDIKTIIPYDTIEGFPVPTVQGHAGRMIFGNLCGKSIVAFQGRIHYYECKDMEKATMLARIVKTMGIEKIILTNAAGGISPDFREGDIMIINDHISSFVPSPLLGNNMAELGPRFPDMTNIYNKQLIKKIIEKADKEKIRLRQGVYLQTTGPNYETPAEINMYAMLGAHAVGMSTACEAMVARHMDMKICGISCITNMAAGLSTKELSHQEVAEVANRVADNFKIVVKFAVAEI